MTVSLVIPAYNEEGRLPAFLRQLSTWNTEQRTPLQEIIVVDDGSVDRTGEIADGFGTALPLRVIRFPENRGKGAAVQAGVLAARGDLVIFLDADGATAAAELPKMRTALARAPIAVGNRWMHGSQVTEREPFRALSGRIYRMYVGFFGLRGIDTMCGFKGFQRDVARTLFEPLREARWLFDTEIMLRARRRGYEIASVPIAWTSKHGSKLHFSALVRAFFALPLLALRVSRERLSPPL